MPLTLAGSELETLSFSMIPNKVTAVESDPT
jgi:hypothetical protein